MQNGYSNLKITTKFIFNHQFGKKANKSLAFMSLVWCYEFDNVRMLGFFNPGYFSLAVNTRPH